MQPIHLSNTRIRVYLGCRYRDLMTQQRQKNLLKEWYRCIQIINELKRSELVILQQPYFKDITIVIRCATVKTDSIRENGLPEPAIRIVEPGICS